MKILVDEIPKDPRDCPQSAIRESKDKYWWISCTKGSFVCEDTKRCKYFKAIADYEKEKKSNGNV